MAPDSRIAFVYAESLSVMEQSVAIDNPQHAQESVRQQLEALSNKLFGEAEEADDSEATKSKQKCFL